MGVNKIKTNEIDFSESTSFASDRYLLGNGEWAERPKHNYTAYVDVINGNNATAEIGRPDLPFQTVLEANTVISGLSLTESERGLVILLPGDYPVYSSETTFDLMQSVDYMMLGAKKIVPTSLTITDSSVWSNHPIGDGAQTIQLQGNGSNINIIAPKIYAGIYVPTSGCKVNVRANIESDTYTSISNNGMLRITNGNVTVFGHVKQENTTDLGNAIVVTGSGTLKVYGNVSTLATSGTTNRAISVSNAAADVSIYGDVSSECGSTTTGSIFISAGKLYVRGRIKNNAAANANGIYKTGGTLILDNCSIYTPNAGYSLAGSLGQVVKIFGSLYCSHIHNTSNISPTIGELVVDSNISW